MYIGLTSDHRADGLFKDGGHPTPITEDLLCPGPSESHKMSQALGKLSLSGSQGLSMSSHNKGIGVTEVEKTKETPGQPRDKYGWDHCCLWEAGEGQCYRHLWSCRSLVSEN